MDEKEVTLAEVKAAVIPDVAKVVMDTLRVEREAEAAKAAEVAAIKAAAREEYAKELEAKVPAWKGGFNLKGVTQLGLAKDAESSFFHWLRTGDEGAVKAALQEGSASEGGYLVPDDFYSTIIERRDAQAWTRQAGVTVIQTSRDIINVPTQTSSNAKFVVAAEEGAYSQVEPTLGQVAISVHKFTKLIKVSEELLEDSAANLDAFLSGQIAQGMALTEGYYVAAGTGTAQPYGITAYASGTIEHYAASSAAEIQVEGDLIPLFYGLNSFYRSRGSWVMNGTVEAYLRALRDANNWILTPQAPGTNGVALPGIFGRPVYNEDGMTGTTSGLPTTTSHHVIFGDFSYYAVVERAGLTVVRNPWLYQATGQVGIFCRFRLGGAVLQGEAFGLLTQG